MCKNYQFLKEEGCVPNWVNALQKALKFSKPHSQVDKSLRQAQKSPAGGLI